MKSFGKSKFKSLFISSTVSMAVETVILLTDTLISGNMLGEEELSAVGIVSPIYYIGGFFSYLIAIGTGYVYSKEIGRYNKEKADKIFGMSVILAVIFGLMLGAILFTGRGCFFDIMGVSPEIRALSGSYYNILIINFMLHPINTLVYEMVTVDGDEKRAAVSYIGDVVGNIILSVVLCHFLGLIGIALGTLLGHIFTFAVLLSHFVSEKNTICFVPYFNLRDSRTVFLASLSEAILQLVNGILGISMNMLVLICYGEKFLPLAIITVNVLNLANVFEGIGTAASPLLNVYLVEKNRDASRKLLKLVSKFSLVEGFGLGIILFVFAPQVPAVFDIDTAECLPACTQIVRGLALLMPAYAMFKQFCYLYTFENDELLVTIFEIIHYYLFAFGIILVLESFAGYNAIWMGFVIASYATLFLMILVNSLRHKDTRPPYLLSEPKGILFDHDLVLTQDGIMTMRDEMDKKLTEIGFSRSLINKVMLFVEELSMLIIDKNEEKVLSEWSFFIDDEGVAVIERDTGKLFSIMDDESVLTSFRDYILRSYMDVTKVKKYAVTCSFNRNMVRFDVNADT